MASAWRWGEGGCAEVCVGDGAEGVEYVRDRREEGGRRDRVRALKQPSCLSLTPLLAIPLISPLIPLLVILLISPLIPPSMPSTPFPSP
eukprot:363744-Chlamydomonas_euryale.AAC.8